MTIALALAAGGLVTLAAAVALLRSLGPAPRIGRLLAATPQVSIDEALAIARRGEARYVRVTGRITSAEEFPDEHDRPLVFRRTRLQLGTRRSPGRLGWITVVDEREAVPFGVETRSSQIAVDEGALAEGLIVIPRESVGHVRDLPDDLGASVPPESDLDSPARLTIEQLSAVEHATVCGTPVTRGSDQLITEGLGRPLIVTTLEQPAAMRVLARGGRVQVVVASALLVTGLGLLAAASVALFMGR